MKKKRKFEWFDELYYTSILLEGVGLGLVIAGFYYRTSMAWVGGVIFLVGFLKHYLLSRMKK